MFKIRFCSQSRLSIMVYILKLKPTTTLEFVNSINSLPLYYMYYKRISTAMKPLIIWQNAIYHSIYDNCGKVHDALGNGIVWLFMK